jgi:DNA-binding MarR family transcriptional regulator
MSTRPSGKSDRATLLGKLWDLGRRMSTQTVFLHEAIAQTVGLNATDTKCIDLILRAPKGMLTAGQIAELSGLTTGAVTHILNRLEKRGFIERLRDEHDRRKVLVRVSEESLAPLTPRYEAIGRRFMSLVEQYGDRELRLICEYMEQATAMSERELAALVAATRSARGRQ